MFKVFQIDARNSANREVLRDLMFAGSGLFHESHQALFEHVATVYVETIDQVFEKMNRPGWRDDKACVTLLAPTRSLSVGDVIYNEDTDDAYMVEPVGFVRIPFDICKVLGHRWNGTQCERCFRDYS